MRAERISEKISGEKRCCPSGIVLSHRPRCFATQQAVLIFKEKKDHGT